MSILGSLIGHQRTPLTDNALQVNPAQNTRQWPTVDPASVFEARSVPSLSEMLATRLRLPRMAEFPFQHISLAETSEKVLVFVVQNDAYVVLEDGKDLFPSDALITQLRLLT